MRHRQRFHRSHRVPFGYQSMCQRRAISKQVFGSRLVDEQSSAWRTDSTERSENYHPSRKTRHWLETYRLQCSRKNHPATKEKRGYQPSELRAKPFESLEWTVCDLYSPKFVHERRFADGYRLLFGKFPRRHQLRRRMRCTNKRRVWFWERRCATTITTKLRIRVSTSSRKRGVNTYYYFAIINTLVLL